MKTLSSALVLGCLLLMGAKQYVSPGYTKSAGGGGSQTFTNVCSAVTSSCTLSASVSTGDVLVAIASTSVVALGGNTITAASGCGATWTVTANVDNSALLEGTNPTAGSCTISFTAVAGGYPYLCAVGVGHTSGGIDAATTTPTLSGTTAPSITASVANDLILGLFIDAAVNGSGSSFTVGTGYTLAIADGYGCAIEARLASATGSYTPTITYSPSSSSMVSASVAIKP